MVTGAAAVVVIAEGLFDGACSCAEEDDPLPPCFYPEPTSGSLTMTRCSYKTKPGNAAVNQNQLLDLAFGVMLS